MQLNYTLSTGEQGKVEIKKEFVTIGRGADADISITDKLASRMHCGISYRDGEYFVRDFQSRNGTFINEQRVDAVKIFPGDKIRIGSTIIAIETKHSKGTETILMEMKEEMDKGKGYHTMLLEIVQGEKKADQR